MPDIFNVLDADNFTREFIKKQISETNNEIDISSNSAFDDLFIKPIVPIIRKLIATISNIDYKSNLKYAPILSEGELDEIGEKNYFCSREKGAKSTGVEIFKFKKAANETTIVIPAGVILTDDSERYRFYTTTRVQLQHDELLDYYDNQTMDYKVPVPIAASNAGSQYNLDKGKITKCLTQFSSLLIGVTNSVPTSGGQDRETNEEYAARLSNFYSSQHLGMKQGYIKDVLSIPGISSVKVIGKNDELMTRDKIYTLNPDAIKSIGDTENGYDEINKEFAISPEYIRYDDETNSYRISEKYLKHIGYGGKVDIYVKGSTYEAQQTKVDMPSPLYTLGIKVSNISGYDSQVSNSTKNEETFYLEVSDTGEILTYYTPRDFQANSNPPSYMALFDGSSEEKTLMKYNGENFEAINSDDDYIDVGNICISVTDGSAEDNQTTVGITPFNSHLKASNTDIGSTLVVPDNIECVSKIELIDDEIKSVENVRIGYIYKQISQLDPVFVISDMYDKSSKLVVEDITKTICIGNITNLSNVNIGTVGYYAKQKEQGHYTLEDINPTYTDEFTYLIVPDDTNGVPRIVQYDEIIIPEMKTSDSKEYIGKYIKSMDEKSVINCNTDIFNTDIGINYKNNVFFYIENHTENSIIVKSQVKDVSAEIGDYITCASVDNNGAIQFTSEIKIDSITQGNTISIGLVNGSDCSKTPRLVFSVSNPEGIKIDFVDNVDDEKTYDLIKTYGEDFSKHIFAQNDNEYSASKFYIQFDYNVSNRILSLYYSTNKTTFYNLGQYTMSDKFNVSGIYYAVNKNNDDNCKLLVYQTSILSSKHEEQYREVSQKPTKESIYKDNGLDTIDCSSVLTNRGEMYNTPIYYKTKVASVNDDSAEQKKSIGFYVRQNWDTRYNYFADKWDSVSVLRNNEGHRHSLLSIPLIAPTDETKSIDRMTLSYKLKSKIAPELYCVDGDYMRLGIMLKGTDDNRYVKLDDKPDDWDDRNDNGEYVGHTKYYKKDNSEYVQLEKTADPVDFEDNTYYKINPDYLSEEIEREFNGDTYDSIEANLDAIKQNIIFNHSFTITKFTTGKNSSVIDYLNLPRVAEMSYDELIQCAADNNIYVHDCATSVETALKSDNYVAYNERKLRARVATHYLSLKANKIYNLAYKSLTELAMYIGITRAKDLNMNETKKAIYDGVASYIIPMCSSLAYDVSNYVRNLNDDNAGTDKAVYKKVESETYRINKQKVLLEFFDYEIIKKHASSYIMATTSTGKGFDTFLSAPNQDEYIDFYRKNDTWTYVKIIFDFVTNKYKIYISGDGINYDLAGSEEYIGSTNSNVKELLVDFSWYFDNTNDAYSRMRYSEDNYFMLDDISVAYEYSEEGTSELTKIYNSEIFKNGVPIFSRGYTIITHKDSDDAMLLIRDENFSSEYVFKYLFNNENNEQSKSEIYITGMNPVNSINSKNNTIMCMDVELPSPTNELFYANYTDAYGTEREFNKISDDGLINYELRHQDLHGNSIDANSIYYQSSQEKTLATIYLNNPFDIIYDNSGDEDKKFYTNFDIVNNSSIMLHHSTNIALSTLGNKYNGGENRIITTDVLVKELGKTYVNIWFEISTSQNTTLSDVEKSEIVDVLRSYISSLPVNSEIQMSDIVDYLYNYKNYVDYVKLPFRSFYVTQNNTDAIIDQNYTDVENVLKADKNTCFELGQCKIIQI